MTVSSWGMPAGITQAIIKSVNKILRSKFSMHDTRNCGSRDGAVVRALASHQYGPGSIPGLGVICGLSLLLVLVPAPRVVHLRVLRFSSLRKIQIQIRPGNNGVRATPWIPLKLPFIRFKLTGLTENVIFAQAETVHLSFGKKFSQNCYELSVRFCNEQSINGSIIGLQNEKNQLIQVSLWIRQVPTRIVILNSVSY